MEEYSYELKIPLERIAVLIGTEGETKKELENNTKSKIDVSAEGDVTITGNDALLLYTARDIVQAIARGFNPKIAQLLLKTDYVLEIIDLRGVAGKSKNTQERLKGRVIGKAGKSREELERLTDTHISVYGKTIGIIGEVQQVAASREAVAMLLSGSMHKTVFAFLERKKKQMLFS